MSFKQRILVGVGYTTLGQLIGYAIRFGSTLILTRLLAPDLYGLMAVGAAFTYAAALLTDVGLRSSIIQNSRADDPDYRDSVWMIIFMRGIIIGLSVCLATATVWFLQSRSFFQSQSVYADPRLLAVLPLLAFAELVKGTESIAILYRERQLDFKSLFTFQTSKQIVNTVTTIVWSWLDPGVVALCSGSIVSHLYGSILSYIWLADRPAKFVWRPDDFKYILEHGKWLLVSAVLTFLMNTVDKVYLASRLDAVELGIYSIATNLGLLAYELATKIGNSVVFPAFSERLRDDRSRLMIDYYKVRRPFEYLALAGGFFLLAFGGDVIHLFYDSRYHAAGDILKALGLFTLMIAYAPSTDAYLAMGEARYNSFVYFVRLSSLIIGLILLVPHFGALGGAFALAVSGFNGALAILICNHRLGLFSWKQESRLLAIFVLGCAAVASLEYVRRAA